MSSIIIYNISGSIFQEINYTKIRSLNKKLKLILCKYYSSELCVQLLINENILNNFDYNHMIIIDSLILLKLTKYDFITIVFNQKKDMYCLDNKNGKYILDDIYKKDNYFKLLKIIIFHYENKSYDIIKNSLYKEIVIKAIEKDRQALAYTTFCNDKEVVLAAVTQDGNALRYADESLKNNKEIVLAAVMQDGAALWNASSSLKNDKEVVLHAVKNDGMSLFFSSIDLKNDKEVVLADVMENGSALCYASSLLKNNKEVVLHAVRKDGSALFFSSIDLQNDKEVILEAIKSYRINL